MLAFTNLKWFQLVGNVGLADSLQYMNPSTYGLITSSHLLVFDLIKMVACAII